MTVRSACPEHPSTLSLKRSCAPNSRLVLIDPSAVVKVKKNQNVTKLWLCLFLTVSSTCSFTHDYIAHNSLQALLVLLHIGLDYTGWCMWDVRACK